MANRPIMLLASWGFMPRHCFSFRMTTVLPQVAFSMLGKSVDQSASTEELQQAFQQWQAFAGSKLAQNKRSGVRKQNWPGFKYAKIFGDCHADNSRASLVKTLQ